MVVVVCPEPFRGVILCLLDGFDDVLVEPFMPDGVVAALDIGVLLRLAGLDVLDGDALFLVPAQQLATDVFGVVACWEQHAMTGLRSLWWFCEPHHQQVETTQRDMKTANKVMRKMGVQRRRLRNRRPTIQRKRDAVPLLPLVI